MRDMSKQELQKCNGGSILGATAFIIAKNVVTSAVTKKACVAVGAGIKTGFKWFAGGAVAAAGADAYNRWSNR